MAHVARSISIRHLQAFGGSASGHHPVYRIRPPKATVGLWGSMKALRRETGRKGERKFVWKSRSEP